MTSIHSESSHANKSFATEPPTDRTASWLAMLLRMALMGGAALSIAWPLTPSSGRWSAVLGAVLGIWAGEKLGRSRLRLWTLVTFPFLAFFLLILATQLWVTWDWPSQWFGWTTALDLAESMRWGGGSFLLTSTLRAYGRRTPAWNILELLLPLLAAASLLSSHRDGQIHRPQQLADWALEQGQDPTWYLLLFGLAGSLFLAFGLLRLRRVSQLFAGLALIALLFSIALWGVSELPYRSIAQSLRKLLGESQKKNQSNKKQSARPQQGQGRPRPGQTSNRQDQQEQMPFQPPQQNQQENQRQKPVAMVVFRNDYKPLSGVYYFRQQVLSQYNGVRLVETHSLSYDRDRAFYFPSSDNQIQIPRSIDWPQRPEQPVAELYRKTPKTPKEPRSSKEWKKLDQATRSFLKFFLESKKKKQEAYVEITTQISLLRKHQRPFALVHPQSLQSLPNPNHRLFLQSYEVSSKAWNQKWGVQIQFGETYWPKEVWNYYTQAPTDPRYRELQQKILTQLKDSPYQDNPMAKAYVIKTWLEINAAYSMRIQPPTDTPDHVGYFLFQTRVGYCVHFAHAAVYLFRLTGIPARISEGYAAPARYRGGGSALLLRSAEAHAWPEVYVRGVGWVPFDIQPRRSLDPAARPPDPDLRRLYSNLARPQIKTPDKQSMYMMGRRTIPWGPILKTFFAVVRNILLYGTLLLLSIGFLLKFGRRWAYWFSPVGPRRRLRFYTHVVDRLSELGILRQPGESLEQFAQRLQDKLPSLSGLVEKLCAHRLGSQLLSEDDDALVFAQIRQELRLCSPWYLRFIQIVRPFAWSRHVWQHWQYSPPPALRKWRAFWAKTDLWFKRSVPLFRRSPA